MKSIIQTTRFATLVLVIICLGSCKKDDSKIAYGISNIYMPQALNVSGGINNNYPVPSGKDSSTLNYFVDNAAHTVNVILGASCSGMQSQDGFSVGIITRPDTIAQLIATSLLDTSTILMPAAVYSLPATLQVGAGKTSATFNLVLNIAQLKLYPGKKLALAVALSNPSRYQLNAGISTTIVIVDVDMIVIGAAVNVTNLYFKNPGSPFVASAMNPSGRWGNLVAWTANDAAKSHGGFGGFVVDDGGTMDLESGWGSPAILNGKIYQTVTLPAGTYAFDPSPWDWQGTKDPAYVVVAPNSNTLPDYSAIVGNTSVYYALFATSRITFKLTATTPVTIGFVVNYVQDQQGFKIKGLSLYNYPNHL